MGLILASTSPIRRALLDAAAIDHTATAPECDEQAVKAAHDGDGASLARRLAEDKALSLSAAPDDWVIGADSVLTVDGRTYSKPRDRVDAAHHLRAFSGRTMILSSAVALAHCGRIAWSHDDTARLMVHDLSDEFITAYLDTEWPDVGYCVGVFKFEGRGVQLFRSVEGSHFTILGLPLLPLLGSLRDHGLIAR